MKRIFRQIIIGGLSCILAVALFSSIMPELMVKASNNIVYENAYNIHEAITYAKNYAVNEDENGIKKGEYGGKEGEYGGKPNPRYEWIPAARGYDCTNFVSQCLIAAGVKEDNKWNSDRFAINLSGSSRYTDAYTTFINVNKLRDYLSSKGYAIESAKIHSGNSLGVITLYPAPGDIIQIDTDNDGIVNHSIICVGYNDKWQLCYAGHDKNRYMKPYSDIEKVFTSFTSDFGQIYLIHMTDTRGLKDVTSRYVKKTVRIKSVQVNQYISSDTDDVNAKVNAVANRNVASTWETFVVEAGEFGTVGFRANNKNYLSARVDINNQFAPVQAAYGKNYSRPQAWESFRIYEKNGIQYIQSQANGKWVQVVADKDPNHTVKASAKEVSSWERFKIEEVGESSISTPSSTSQVQSQQPLGVQWVDNKDFYKTEYISGKYTGYWDSSKPNGNQPNGQDGTLIYSSLSGMYKGGARSYKGSFVNGARDGWGVTYYTDCRYEGYWYGMYDKGKLVFDGKVIYTDGQYKGYTLIGKMIGTSATTAEWSADTHWESNSVSNSTSTRVTTEAQSQTSSSSQTSIILTVKSGGSGYQNAFSLEWTRVYDHSMKVFRKDVNSGYVKLIHTTNPKDTFTWDGGMYDWPDRNGRYEYYVIDTVSNIESNHVIVDFTVVNGAAASQEQRATVSDSDNDSNYASSIDAYIPIKNDETTYDNHLNELPDITWYDEDYNATEQQSFATRYSIKLYIGFPQMDTINGRIDIDSNGTSPVVLNNRTLLPVRAILEQMGGSVEWDNKSDPNWDKVTCVIDGYYVEMWIGYNKFYVNGQEMIFEIPPQLINNRTMIPARALFESIGCNVDWEKNGGGDGWDMITITYWK